MESGEPDLEGYKLVTVKLDPNAEIIEKLLLVPEVRLVVFKNALGTYTAQLRNFGERPRHVPFHRETDDVTPIKAIVRLAYKFHYRQIVTWEE